MSIVDVQPRVPTVPQYVVTDNWSGGLLLSLPLFRGSLLVCLSSLCPTEGASSDARILTSDAQNDKVDLVDQVRPNTNCTNDLVGDDIAIPVQSDLVVAP